ncbi:helicase-associated domain-containing protein [Rhodococcus sp. H29-C3]|uniref:helicase-associated domain-containing protein n=1 Tax=Rhodococcus sp. H29-C3 TaxID=3046307 RepID=UPI0024BAED77|nr:helicase-associated domain-containing protein [Rhodococcus sp. H29-C3]MDJ0360256.1 helicase-associated domain-containing protein [Rhodococcus sp. H29-C3]
MTDTAVPPDLAAWLSSRTDNELVSILTLRPDLTVPPPTTIGVLAGRAEQRASILRCADALDTLALTILEILALEGAHEMPVERERLDAAVGKRATTKAVDKALGFLRERALVWGTGSIRMPPAARDAVPWRIGRILDPTEDLTPERITDALARIGEGERTLLMTLARSSPTGRTRDAAPGTSEDRPVQKLLRAGLLIWLDEQTVELPQQVGQALRGEPIFDPTSLTPPKRASTKYPLTDVNAAAAGEALELIRHCALIIEALSITPAPALKAGGLGVREVKRITKATGLDEHRVSLLLEVLAAASLITSGTPDPLPPNDSGEDYWGPTPAVEPWTTATPASRWQTLAAAWLDVQRAPWLIGMRDPNDKPVAALSEEVRSPAAPRDRRTILEFLAELGPGNAIAEGEVSRGLAWRRPRAMSRYALRPISKMIGEATAMGIVARGALSTPGKALLHGGDAEAAMRAALPEPIDYVLIQADLTLVAPGPLEPDLEHRIELVADVESAGAATVYRITENSLRRALDVGMSAAELHALFAAHSRTPVPQGLTYLIDDVARRHGRLRAGVAASFVRCEDPALLAEVLTSAAAEQLALRALAPTVAISQAPLNEVMRALDAAGFAPAGEDANGIILDLRSRGARIPLHRVRSTFRQPAIATDEQLTRLVSELRAGDRASRAGGRPVLADGTRATGSATMALLHTALKARRSVSIGYVDAQGVASQRIVDPVNVGGGQLDAYVSATGEVRRFTLHRITSVALID